MKRSIWRKLATLKSGERMIANVKKLIELAQDLDRMGSSLRELSSNIRRLSIRAMNLKLLSRQKSRIASRYLLFTSRRDWSFPLS
ncbi:hypothetical protein [Mesotoga sp.]|uniref:hypothetical protein n=1 Tax=Mesotoga sp. TaxID=2053577 RepID=UPI00345EEEB5